MPFDSQDIRHKPFVAFVCTDVGAATARAVMAASGGSEETIHGGGLSGAARLSPDTFTGQVVLAELGQIGLAMACECVTELRQSGIDVIVLGKPDDLGTYRALRQAGALDYFPFPVKADDILAVEAAPVSAQVVQMVPTKGRSIGIVGCKGGVGASLLAQNLAAHASAEKGAALRTALVDADLEFGTQAIDLDREDTRGLFDALSAPERVDSTFITATMEQIGERLSLYSGQVRAGQEAGGFEAGFAALLPRLQSDFDAVITDIPRGMLLRHPEIASGLDSLVLVIPAGYGAVNAASRLIDHVARASSDLTILPVLSEVRMDAGISDKDIATTLGRALTARLPRCDAALAKAHRAAKPLVLHQRRAPWAKAIGQIWDAAMADAKPQTAPAKRRKGLFG